MSVPSQADRSRVDDYYLAEGTVSSVLETVPYVNLPSDKLAESRSTWDSSK